MAPHFANGGHGGEIVCGILGIVIVLVVGSDLAEAQDRAEAASMSRAAA